MCDEKTISTKSFKVPAVEEVETYAHSIGFLKIDAEAFIAYYEARGWKLNGQPMKSWRACVVTWKKNHMRGDYAKQTEKKPNIHLPPKGDMSEYLPK